MSNLLKTTVLLGGLTGLFVIVGGALGGHGGMLVAFVLAVALNLGAYWFSGDVALKLAGAREVTPAEAPWLHAVVADLAARAGLPRPRVALVDSPAPNAFATGRDPAHAVVAVTTGIQDVLTRDELAAVLAHELGHVRNRDVLVSSIAATLAGAITMLAQMAQWSMLLGGFGGQHDEEDSGGGLVGGLLLMILAPIAATIIQLAVSRAREYGADATGARLHGDPEPLARALEKLEHASTRIPTTVNPATAHLYIVNPLRGARLAALFSTHPPSAERARRLRAMGAAPWPQRRAA